MTTIYAYTRHTAVGRNELCDGERSPRGPETPKCCLVAALWWPGREQTGAVRSSLRALYPIPWPRPAAGGAKGEAGICSQPVGSHPAAPNLLLCLPQARSACKDVNHHYDFWGFFFPFAASYLSLLPSLPPGAGCRSVMGTLESNANKDQLPRLSQTFFSV